MKIEKVTEEDFIKYDEESKYKLYEEIYRLYSKKVDENERQYKLLSDKQDKIITLKEIVYGIIDKIGI